MKNYLFNLLLIMMSAFSIAQTTVTSPSNFTTQSTNPTTVTSPTQDVMKCDSVCVSGSTYSNYSNTTVNKNVINAQSLTLISPVIGGNGKGGTKTGTTCVGVDLYDTWSDGTQTLNTANATSCQPPPPTKNGTVCVGYDLYDTWTNGTQTLNTTNSTSCGYVAPTPPTPPTPTCIGNQVSSYSNFCSFAPIWYFNGCTSNGAIMTWGGYLGYNTASCPSSDEYFSYQVQCFCF